jgi:hypothetical protein
MDDAHEPKSWPNCCRVTATLSVTRPMLPLLLDDNITFVAFGGFSPFCRGLGAVMMNPARTRPARVGFRRARWIWLAGSATLAALALTGVSNVAASGNASPRSAAASSQDLSSTRTSNSSLPTACPGPVSPGNSCVMTDSPRSAVKLRSCPRLPNAGVASGECEGYVNMLDSTQVTMRCWVDTYPPADDSHTSPRWFYVNEVNGFYPGYSGYVYSVLVVQQVKTPGCTQQIISQYQDPKPSPPPPPLHFQVVGSCTSAGGTLTAVSSDFTPGSPFSVSATYPDGSPYPLAYTTGTVHADGSVTWRWPCAGDPPGVYYTALIDLSDSNATGEVPFTIGSSPQGSSGGSPPVVPPPGASPPSAPPSLALDADATPAFGTCPSNPPPYSEKYCGGWSNSCATASFSQANCPNYVSQGTAVDPVCWASGQTIYNNYSAAASGPNWTLDSDIWVRVSNYPSDPWMNELWFNPDDTASNGLPHC